MQRELCEDILEAMLLAGAPATPVATSIHELASCLDRIESELVPAISRLEEQGCISRDPDHLFTLTGKGLQAAQSVASRHKVLECFLSTILGMAPDEASREACSLEHSVSDQVIGRIGEYIEGRGTRCHGQGKYWGRTRKGSANTAGIQDRPEMPALLPCPVNLENAPLARPLHVRMVQGGDCLRRLLDLGIIPGETITLVRRLPNGAVVVGVKGTEIALSPEVAAVVEVEPPG